MLRFGDHLFADQVDQAENRFGRCPVILKIDLARVHGVIPDHSYRIQRLLNTHIEALADE
jgi:hypothetical protein